MTTEPPYDSSDERSLVAEYVLGVLSASEHDRVGRLIEDTPRLRAERDFWTTHFSALDDEFEPVPAPQHLYARIDKRLFGATTAGKTSFWDNLALWRGLAAGALAVAVVAVGLAIMPPATQAPSSAPQLVAMLEEPGSDVRLVAYYDGSDQLRLTTLAGQPPADRDYELWVIEGGNAPKSMGILSAEAPTVVELPETEYAQWNEDALLAVTLEPLGGGPGGVPTGPIVAKGTLTRI